MVDASDNNPAIMLEAEKFTVSNYIVAEYRDSGLRLPKYPASIDEKLIGMEFFELVEPFYLRTGIPQILRSALRDNGSRRSGTVSPSSAE